jgi:F-type H+-transporting ATPase subunit b
MNKLYNSGGRQRFRKIYLYICVLSSVFYISGYRTVFAAEGGGHAFTWRDWFWPIVNFAILVAVLVIFGRKPVTEYFKKRTELIERSINEATEARKLAREALEEVRERLKNVDTEVKEILEAAQKAGEKEKGLLIAQGEEMKKKILEQTKANIEFELEKAKKALKAEATIMALELAEKHVKEKLGRKEQEALVDEYIKRLEVRG